MEIVQAPSVLQSKIIELKKEGKRIAVVPTMGALHEGHLSLVHRAVKEADIVVVTLFVNPTQFAPHEDLDTYPRPFEKDCSLAQEAGADFLFAPTPVDMYPEGFDTTVSCGGITSRLEGASRPGHFDGVTTVVLKLFLISQADCAVFGQKDAQQVLVLKKMVQDLNVPVEMIIAPTVREEDGLAMSSRNKYLSETERRDVTKINEGLKAAADLFEKGERKRSTLIAEVDAFFNKGSMFSKEYISLANAECFEIMDTVVEGALLSVACRTKESQTRLIDNYILGTL